MNIAIEIGRIFDLELRRLEHQREDTDARAAWIAQRAATLADAMARSPAADRALREALERRDLIDEALDTLHAMLWEPTSARTADMVRTLKAQVQDCAASDIGLLAYAREHAEREMQA